jgi:hypothetical protein
VGDLSISYGQRATEYAGIAKRLRQDAARGIRPVFTAARQEEKDRHEDDTTMVSPGFKIGMHDRDSTGPDDDRWR